MKRNLFFIILFSCGLIKAADSNCVGMTQYTIKQGTNCIENVFCKIGGGVEKIRTILPYTLLGDEIILGGKRAEIQIVSDDKHWVANDGTVVDDWDLPSKGEKIVIIRKVQQETNIVFSGEAEITQIEQSPSAHKEPKVIHQASVVKEPELHLADYLSYSTILISVEDAQGRKSTGTGFFFDVFHKVNPMVCMPIIITNKHVVDGAKKIKLRFTLAKNGRPSSKVVDYNISNFSEKGCFYHPDSRIDLCAIPILPALNEIEKTERMQVFRMPYTVDLIPDETEFQYITQMDEVAMIGYPSGLSDYLNNLPIFRKGAIATRPNVSFKGERVYLIDMTVYPGSSGSPILLVSEGVFYDRKIKGLKYRNRLCFMGVVKSVSLHQSVDHLFSRQGRVGDVVVMRNQFSNLGYVIHPSCVRELNDLLYTKFLKDL